tara:strand:- start:4 stop:378 length:375 start_codon:yes stop_codon:yes gene_type:complete
MALSKESTFDYEVRGDYKVIQIREKISVMEDGEELSFKYHRRSLMPDADVSSESDEVKALADAVWTDAVKDLYSVSVNGHPSGEPANSWTVDQLKKYLDNNSVSYSNSEAKSSLLTKAKDKYNE